MQSINLDKIACPHDGTSGAENLNADAQIEHTGYVDGDGWINCPTCGAVVEFTEAGVVTSAPGTEAFEWAVQIASALEGAGIADATVSIGSDA